MDEHQNRFHEDIKIRSNPNTQFAYQITSIVIVVSVGILIGFALFNTGADHSAYVINLCTGALSTAFTVGVIEATVRHRDQVRAERELKERLIREMGSRSNDTALSAVEQLRYYKWLHDGSLNTKPATVLQKANLQNADLRYANLKNLHIVRVNLFNADLTGADLRGAWLYESNLEHATLSATGIPAMFDNTTMLPDNTAWTPETDMRRFTDPNHPQFWRSKDTSSPAFSNRIPIDGVDEPLLTKIVRSEVEDYARATAHKASSYAISDIHRQIYAVVDVPDYPQKFPAQTIVMARILNEKVVIDEDITDRPLVKELVRAGIPREQIILAYAGESLPEAK
jgi:hypothetical protein